jgi:hypothetical protein
MIEPLPQTTPQELHDTRVLRVPTRAHRALAAVRSRLAEGRGQALPEFALLLPIIAIVLFGIIEFGLALNSENDETHLANEVARYAIVNEDPGGSETLQEWAKKQGDSNFLKSGAKICISFPEGTGVGMPVKVEASSELKWIPALELKTLSSTIRGTAYMRLEASPSAYKAGCSS